MTENKRYFDGSLAKWYYSRDYNGMMVISNGVDEFALNSKKPCKDINSKELNGTNQLLDELNKLEDKIIILENENKELQEKNEQLKFDKQQLHRAMSRKEVKHKQFKDKVFDLIDEKIKEYSNLEQRERTSSDTIEILKELKKELSDK
jgi:hypothetical protein